MPLSGDESRPDHAEGVSMVIASARHFSAVDRNAPITRADGLWRESSGRDVARFSPRTLSTGSGSFTSGLP